MAKGSGTIFVTFYDDVGDKSIEAYLNDLGLSGTRVSQVGKRWAVEVPPNQEQKFINQLSQDPVVERVSSSFIPGHLRTATPKKKF
jgi:hypothetical protein